MVAVGSDKGSPGASTLAVLLGMVWPGERLVCELDLRGADLPYRMKNTAPHELVEGPSLAALAIDARLESDRRPLPMYAQETTVGVPLIVGEPSCERFSRLLPHLPAIGTTFADWSGTVIADLGCLQPWNPAVPLAGLASVLLLVTRSDTESLGHLRDRVHELAGQVGGTQRGVGIAVRAPRNETRAAVRRVERLLASVGSPASVVGPLREDPQAAAELWSGAVTGRFLRSALFESTRDLVERLCGTWSEPNPTAEPSECGGWTS
jgi:hypothetical protein